MNLIASIAVLCLSAVAATTDARTGRIPNWLTLPAIALGIAFHAVQSGVLGAGASAGGLLVCGAVPWVLHRTTGGRGIGGGDIKLFAALGAFAGPFAGLEIELSAFLLLGVFALIRLAFQGVLLRVLLNTLWLAANPLLPKAWRRTIRPESLTEMRMGPAIAVAVVVVLVRDHWLSALPWIV